MMNGLGGMMGGMGGLGTIFVLFWISLLAVVIWAMARIFPSRAAATPRSPAKSFRSANRAGWSTADPQRSSARVDAEVGEGLRHGPRGTPGAPRDEDHGLVRYGMLFSVHADQTRTRHANDQHVDLVVDVLSDASSRLETNQVGVEVSAPFEGPDHALPPGRRSSHLAKVH